VLPGAGMSGWAFARGHEALRARATVTDRRYTRRWELDFQRREISRLFPPFPPLTAFGGSFYFLFLICDF
jgi:hypothetical protein